MKCLDIIIVNWNSGDQLRHCIESIRRHGFEFINACIVVDNNSSDRSMDFLNDDTDIISVRNKENIGFGAACNVGARISSGKYILFLNPDTLLMNDSLVAPVLFLEAQDNQDVGIVGVQLVDELGSVQRTCARLPTPMRMLANSLGLTRFNKNWDYQMKAWDHQNTQRVDQVMGAFLMIRRNLFERLDGFDERFFVYFEEVDLSCRCISEGYCSMYLKGPKVYHKGGGTSSQVLAKRLFYSLRSRMKYAFKHFSFVSALTVAFFTMMVEPVTRAVHLIGTGKFRQLSDLFIGYRLLWCWLVSSVRLGR